MSSISQRAPLAEKAAEQLNKTVSHPETSVKNPTPRMELQNASPKLVTLDEAIRRSGLKDGMTISFHHHFRGGDKVVNLVVGRLAEMGFKDLHLAASSLSDVHAPLIEHIELSLIHI